MNASRIRATPIIIGMAPLSGRPMNRVTVISTSPPSIEIPPTQTSGSRGVCKGGDVATSGIERSGISGLVLQDARLKSRDANVVIHTVLCKIFNCAVKTLNAPCQSCHTCRKPRKCPDHPTYYDNDVANRKWDLPIHYIFFFFSIRRRSIMAFFLEDLPPFASAIMSRFIAILPLAS